MGFHLLFSNYSNAAPIAKIDASVFKINDAEIEMKVIKIAEIMLFLHSSNARDVSSVHTILVSSFLINLCKMWNSLSIEINYS